MLIDTLPAWQNLADLDTLTLVELNQRANDAKAAMRAAHDERRRNDAREAKRCHDVITAAIRHHANAA